MAINRKIYEIRLEDISQNGNLCTTPSVTWEEPYCTDVRCFTEQTDGTTILKVEIPEDCPDPCVYVIIDCLDDCGECEPERIKICPCEVDADCPDCEVCQDNLCVTTCLTGEFCSGGDCVECDDTVPCPCNQVCVNGDCQCPPGKTNVDSKGCCSDCLTDSDCDPCYVCSADGCEPKICPEGVCDPVSGDCVECNGTGDCAGDNECCISNECECCFGFVRDSLGDCVPDPGCLTDADCPDCYICDSVTGCEPQSCPAGYVFTGTFPCCQKECDCDAPACPGVENCIPIAGDVCVCTSCFGACDANVDCGEGCYCDNGQCKPNPCYGICHNGGDCGEGCGCFEGYCYPCESASCQTTECAQTSGCECVGINCAPSGCVGACLSSNDCGPGCGCYQGNCVSCEDLVCEGNQCAFAAGCDCIDNNCEPSPCKEACVNADNCDGVDCGCYGGECVKCQAYTCDSDPCPEGCYCDDGICMGNPCRNNYCENNGDCGINCFCEGGLCQPCPPENFDCGKEGCKDLLIVGKDDDTCELVATLSQKDCCSCEDLVIAVDFSTAAGPGYGATATTTLRVGNLGSDDWNDLPLLTTVLDPSGNPVLPTAVDIRLRRTVYFTNGSEQTTSINISSDLIGDDTSVRNFTHAFPGFDPLGNPTGISKVVYFFTGSLTLANQCEYQLQGDTIVFESLGLQNFTQFIAAFDAADMGLQFTKVTQCRAPLFVFQKGTTQALATSNAAFHYEYGTAVIPPSPTDQKIWVAKADLAEGISYNQYHRVSVDCGCATPALYSCYGPGELPTKLVFCHLEDSDLLYTIDPATNCTEFDFDSDITITCDVMAAGNPQYRVLVNGAVLNSVPVVTAAAGTIPLVALGTIVSPSPVTSVGLRLVEDVCHICDIDVPGDCERFEGVFSMSKASCDISGTFSVTITTNAGPLVQQSYDILDTVPASLASGTFYGPTVTITGITDPVSPEPITVNVVRLSDSVGITDTQLLDPAGSSAAAKLLLNTGCSGSTAYVRGTNNFGSSATLQVFAAGTLTSLGSANVAPGGTGTVTFPENTLVDITFSLNADPTCAVTDTNVTLNCCGNLEVGDFLVEQECIEATQIRLTLTNNSAITTIFEVKNPSGTVIATKTITASSSGLQTVTKTLDGTYSVTVRSASTSGCDDLLLTTFNFDDCCEDITDQVTLAIECRSGNGPGAVGTLVVTNGTVGPKAMQVYLIVGTSATLLYNGTAPVFEYTPPTAPSSASIRIVVDGCEKTEAVFFNCEQ